MCGIVGIVGRSNACKSALNVLKNLEYRGYDSAGLAYLQKNHLNTIKALGKLNKLKSKFEVLEEDIKDISIVAKTIYICLKTYMHIYIYIFIYTYS